MTSLSLPRRGSGDSLTNFTNRFVIPLKGISSAKCKACKGLPSQASHPTATRGPRCAREDECAGTRPQGPLPLAQPQRQPSHGSRGSPREVSHALSTVPQRAVGQGGGDPWPGVTCAQSCAGASRLVSLGGGQEGHLLRRPPGRAEEKPASQDKQAPQCGPGACPGMALGWAGSGAETTAGGKTPRHPGGLDLGS